MYRGFAAPLLLTLVVLVVISIYYVSSRGIIDIPFIKEFPGITQNTTSEPKLEVKSSYQNPFDENAQYVNPFSEYHNPFDYVE